MLRFDDIVEGLKNTEKPVQDYFLECFTAANYKQYQIDYELDSAQRKAVKTMFESKKDLNKRVEAAFKHNPFCLEAFFVYFVVTEDVFVNYRFESYFNQSGNYGDFDAYEKYCYIAILDFYVEFLLDIRNISRAIKVQRMIMRLSSDINKNMVNRLALMYSIIEDSDEFYRLYLDSEFDEYDYLLLLVTLLKNDEKMKAKEVLADMFKNIQYSDYLDHLWDLDMNDENQKQFYDVVEDCFDDISGVPDFFSWVNFTKEDMQE